MAWGCLLTILTGFIFLPFWILADFVGVLRPYRCQVCGRARHRVGALFVLLVVLIVVRAAFIPSLWPKGVNQTSEQAQSVNEPASKPAEASSAEPIPSPVAISQAMPTQPAVPTEAWATRPVVQQDDEEPAEEPDFDAPPASQSRQSAAEALGTATRACLTRLKATDAYKDAARKFSEAAAKVESLRGEGTMDDRLAAANARLIAAKDLRMLEANALANDEAVGVARKSFATIRDREEKDAAAIADAKIEKDRIANSPVNKAIRGHYLIQGMTYEEAVEALGKPYSVTNAGNAVSATWEFGNGNFWSATFFDDVAAIVSHTRL